MRSKSIAAVVGALALALPASAMAGNGPAQTSKQWSETIRTAESQAQVVQNDTVVCGQAGENTSGSSQCRQDNTSTVTQTSTATGGNGGTATGGNSGPSLSAGSQDPSGGSASANGGSAESGNSNHTTQGNQNSGASSSQGSDPAGEANNAAICDQLAGGNTSGISQCEQTNSSTVTQRSTATGGNGGTATGGKAGPALCAGSGGRASWRGGEAPANGGDDFSGNWNHTTQGNQISGNNSSQGPDPAGQANNSALCDQLAFGNTTASSQCEQHNTSTATQTSTATGGNGGSATGGSSGRTVGAAW